jgi:deoxycytidine triphosphate deaminase
MIYNPRKVIENKYLEIPNGIDITKHIQQHGIDIDCDRIYEVSSDPFIISEREKYNIDCVELESSYFSEVSGFCFKLEKGKTYTFDSQFFTNIPDFLGAEVVGRSTFNRNGIFIRSSWFDPGFKGLAGGTIYCHNRDLIIERGTRIAQIIFHEGESASLYKGQYQTK